MSSTKASLPVVDLNGKVLQELSVAPEVFSIDPVESAVHFVCEGQRFRFYKKTVSTKGRAQVSGGGKKARQQKGSGGARQGSSRAPHWVGGGIAFGPTPVKRDFKMNRKIKSLALASGLSNRHAGGQIKVLRAADLKAPQSSKFAKFLSNLSMSSARVGFVVSATADKAIALSVRNLPNVDLLTEEKWTTLDFVKTDALIFSEQALEKVAGQVKQGGAA